MTTTTTDRRFYCDAINAQPVDFDWSDRWRGEDADESRWDIVYFDVDSWGLERCSAYLSDEGYSGNEPTVNPYPHKGDAAALIAWADEQGIIAPDEPIDDPAELWTYIVDAIDNEEIDGIEDWRAACRVVMEEKIEQFEPMMNYYYPIPHLTMSPQAAQEAIMHTACVVVLVDDEPVLLGRRPGRRTRRVRDLPGVSRRRRSGSLSGADLG